jgi:CopA family copper-resistance protein
LGLFAGFQRLVAVRAFGSTGLTPKAPGELDADAIDLSIREQTLRFGDRRGAAIAINGTVPGPVVRLREGHDAILRVTNGLAEDTSIHWHGLLVPPSMDGVPGVSFGGIKPGETFTYRFPVRQNGTYWYHSHSAGQEQAGHYGPVIIDAAGPEPFQYDREHVVLLSDWTSENPMRVMSNLKRQSSYYNFQRRTLGTFFRDKAKNGLRATLKDRLEWGAMRMDPTDISDVTGYTYTYLMNGLAPEANWTALFRPGERVRLRFINAGAATYFDLRIPGLLMTVVSVDGQHVQPVTVEEIRIAIAETYDVIVEPKADHAYTIFAEAIDRSGYARGTLATEKGLTAAIPPRRQRPVATMADMGMGGMAGMSGMGKALPAPKAMGGMSGMSEPPPAPKAMADMPGMTDPPPQPKAMADMPGMKTDVAAPIADSAVPNTSVKHGPDHHGPGNSSVPMETKSRLGEPGTGLENTGPRVLLYSDLRSLNPGGDSRPAGREIELHITGNMERYVWGFDGKKFSESEPIRFYHGERLRLTLVNDTMMNHPIHLHGMFMELDNGAGAFKPKKHTINVKPAERLSLYITADALGNWAFHCHILYHMEMGMFRIVSVVDTNKEAS